MMAITVTLALVFGLTTGVLYGVALPVRLGGWAARRYLAMEKAGHGQKTREQLMARAQRPALMAAVLATLPWSWSSIGLAWVLGHGQPWWGFVMPIWPHSANVLLPLRFVPATFGTSLLADSLLPTVLGVRLGLQTQEFTLASHIPHVKFGSELIYLLRRMG
jgi:hypothetical protein